jgi:hypothetical protein
MTSMPIDIINKIHELFPASNDQLQVKELIGQVYRSSLNVGADQLARAILVLSDGQIDKIKNIIACDFYGDPRDVIMEADAKLGNPGHYFIHAFKN